MIYLLKYQQLVQVKLRFSPCPEQIPARLHVHAMREFPPPLHPQKGRGNDVVHLFPITNHSVTHSVLLIVKPAVQVFIEDTQPGNHLLNVDVRGLSMSQQLPWLIDINCIVVIEGSEQRFPVAVRFHDFTMDAEQGVHLLHDDIDVQDSLGNWFHVVYGK